MTQLTYPNSKLYIKGFSGVQQYECDKNQPK